MAPRGASSRWALVPLSPGRYARDDTVEATPRESCFDRVRSRTSSAVPTERVSALRRRLDALEGLRLPRRRKARVEEDEETLEALRALGYLEPL